jgi:ATP-dependent protease Clp ATPase subunit
MRKQTVLYCSFCGKSQHEVEKLIAGPKVISAMNASTSASEFWVLTANGATRK